jgi:hypothetical protein
MGSDSEGFDFGDVVFDSFEEGQVFIGKFAVLSQHLIGLFLHHFQIGALIEILVADVDLYEVVRAV